MDVSILQFFEEIRNPVLTAIFGCFSLLGEAAVIAGIVILVYWLAPKKVGEQALVTVLTGYALNSYIKYTAARPRPYVAGAVKKLDPPFGGALDEFASFPSGHTQATTGFFGAAASRSKRVAVWILCTTVVLLIGISRTYFGVHYPSDVLAGLLFGLLIAVFWALVYRVIYAWRYLILLVFAALSLLPLFSSPAHDYIRAAGFLTGAAVALVCLQFTSADSQVKFPRRLWRIPVGLALLAAAFMLTMLLPAGEDFTLLQWFLLAFTAIFVAQTTFERLQI